MPARTGGGVTLLIVLLAAIAAGFSGTIIYELFALSGEGACGSVSGCPPGGWLRWIAYPLMVAGFLVLLGAIRFTEGGRGPLALLLAAVMALGIIPGHLSFRAAHGPTLTTAWATPPEQQGTVSLGTWVYGGAIIRVWRNGLSAFDTETGRPRWSVRLAADRTLCTMSGTHAGGIGLIGRGSEKGPCSTVAALDLATGRTLWQRPFTLLLEQRQVRRTDTAYNVLAVTGNVAVVRKPKAMRGFDLRTGRALWRHKTARCTFGDLTTGAGDRALTQISCDGEPSKIRSFNAATGATRWQTPIPGVAGVPTVGMVSAFPAVVRVAWDPSREASAAATAGAPSTIESMLSLDDQGSVRAAIPVRGRPDRVLDVRPYGFAAAPLRRLAIARGLLIVTSRTGPAERTVTAYSLSDGKVRWTVETGDVAAMTVRGDRLLVLTYNALHTTSRLYTLAPADGAQGYVGLLRMRFDYARAGLFTGDGADADADADDSANQIIVVRERATGEGQHPFAAVRLPG